MRKFLIGLVALAVIGVACGSNDDDAGASATPPASTPSATVRHVDACAPESLNLLTAGTLTIGTDNPAFQPWFGGTGTLRAVEGTAEQRDREPGQRRGLRERGRLRDRRAARA